MLKIYNSLTQKKEEFKPIDDKKVKLYVCGLTVYDYCHLGNARTFISFDNVVRYLKYRGYDVHYIRNITDIDDKIIKRANENNVACKEITSKFINALHDDFKALGLLEPNEEPKATTFIDQIIQMVKTLVDKGYAYVGKNGDVYYEVRKFKGYGKLSHRNIDDLESGARVEVSHAKRDPLDFVLWKLAKPGEPAWESPWGAGRPGWHIECSSMSTTCLAPNIDIHGGGKDLIFPHHENEIAQSEAATGQPFVNYWMHGGYLEVDKAKMSKSLGNFFTLRDILKQYHPEVIRYFMASSHYRSPLNYTQDSLEQAKVSLARLYNAMRGVNMSHTVPADTAFEQQFIDAMDDDFNTPKALSVLFEISKEINKLKDKDKKKSEGLSALLKQLGGLIGILQENPDSFLQGGSESDLSDDDIDRLMTERTQARQSKDWARSDQIRDELAQKGIVLEDGAVGTTWRRA